MVRIKVVLFAPEETEVDVHCINKIILENDPLHYYCPLQGQLPELGSAAIMFDNLKREEND